MSTTPWSLAEGVSSDGFSDCNNTQQSLNAEFVETTDALAEVSLDPQSGIEASPVDTVENRPKGRKKRGICTLFRETWKIVKRPFLLCHRTRVEPIVPPLQPDTHPSDPELTPVPCASGLEQRPDGEWTGSEPSSVTGPYRLEETAFACPTVPQNTPNADSDYPKETSESMKTYDIMSITSSSLTEGSIDEKTLVEVNDSSDTFSDWNDIDQPWMSSMTFDIGPTDAPSEAIENVGLDTERGTVVSPIDAVENNPKGRRKKKGICALFRETWKIVKRPFLLCHRTRVEPIVPPLQPGTHPSGPELTSVPCASGLEQRPDGEGIFSTGSPWLEECPAVPENTLSSDSGSCFEPSDGCVDSHYKVGGLLGKGGFGAVCEGTRISDGQKVAIKFLSKLTNNRCLVIPGHSKPLPREVALMLMMRQPPKSPFVVQMFEWFEDPSNITVIMEYPHPCHSLHNVILRHNELRETTARVLMRQAVLAVQHCIDHGVFHSDIHPGNMLVNTRTLQLKLIDFGCGQLYSGTLDSYQYAGVPAYCPPEVLKKPTFHAIPANVWSLGLVLFEMVNGCLPEEALFENLDLSRACRDIIQKCLNRYPAKRPTLEQILQHRWIKNQIQH